MRDAAFERNQVAKYLIWTFALAWAVQGVVALLYRSGSALWQLVTAAMMFVPTLGVLLAGGRLDGMGWKPRLRRNLKWVLVAWFAPLVLTAVGAALYFIAFPKHFDLSGSTLQARVGGAVLAQMAEKGISIPMYVLISAVGCVTYAPLINGLVALGEEIGWRGFLYTRLKARFGRRKGWLLGGAIWGAWHWPMIALIGYEYGEAAGNAAGYVGAPVVGMLLFCVITIAWGALHDWLYEKSGSIWLPAVLHGAINAAGTLPWMLCLADTGSARLLGPAPNGLLAGLPFLAVAAVLFIRAKDGRGANGAA